jgi:hypothetical protein
MYVWAFLGGTGAGALARDPHNCRDPAYHTATLLSVRVNFATSLDSPLDPPVRAYAASYMSHEPGLESWNMPRVCGRGGREGTREPHPTAQGKALYLPFLASGVSGTW